MKGGLAGDLYQRVYEYIKHTTGVEPIPAKGKGRNLDQVSFKKGKKTVPYDICLQLIIE